uniref:Coiled-coil domain containing 9B n=1 Tax=Mastacembelus armatus TaxID=205130 RepID=A0A3Q3LPX4_9TELE
MVTMAGKKGKRVVSERPEKRPGPTDVKSPTDDGQAKRVESAGRGKQQPHMAKKDVTLQDEVKQGQKHSEDHHRLSEQCQEAENLQASTDLNVPTSKEEQEEYVRWKKEREQIDRERVARHKNAKGQWRRAWDMDKTENMFSDKSLPDRDWGPSSRGGRNTRRGQPRPGADSRGHEKRGKDKGVKNVLVMSSKAKGKDRLTGRARRWQANEEGENLQVRGETCISDTTLEEFLEELDALTDTEGEDQKEQDSKTKLSPSPDSSRIFVEGSGCTAPVSATTLKEDPPTQGKSSSPRGSEKKVRFSEELIQGTNSRQTTGSQDSVSLESRSPSSLKVSSPKKNKHELQGSQQHLESAKQDDGSPQDQGGGPSVPPVAQEKATEIECTKNDSHPLRAPIFSPAEIACASLQVNSVQPAELAKCNISNTNSDELIDSGLSVLSLESGETHPTHSTSSDKAREHGKIV